QIGRQPLSDPFRATSEIYTLDLMLHQGEDAGVVASILSEMGGNVLVANGSLIRVEIHRTRLAAVAGLEPVFMVEEWQRRFTRAEETTNVIQTGYYFAGGIEAPSPYHAAGLRGEGQVLMVLDSGVSIDAGDMSETDSVAGTPGPLHRKVLLNQATTPFGGLGDTSSCDDPLLGGFTHGQVVSATALGWATDVDPAYGTGFFALDIAGNQFSLDGVAPKAKLVFYDGNQTPATGNCGNPESGGISPGDLYSGGAGGSLGDSWTNYGAKITNFSWGEAGNNTYNINAIDIDTFLDTVEDAMVFVSAGNEGSDEDSDGIPDLGTLGAPATCKNCLAIGASGNANSNGARRTERDRAFFSSTGPTPANRVAPQLMAPGQERGGLGVPSEFACRSNDNDQTGTVECDVSEGSGGTSFASPAAAGAALLVRDYFASGFYPDGTTLNPSNAGDQRANISGSLVKAVLIAGADFMAFPNNVLGANNTVRYRFNNEQGYGRIQLDNVLPLAAWSLSPVGIIVKDGGLTDDVFGDLSGLSGVMPLAGGTQSELFQVCDDTYELRIALTWMEAQGDTLQNDLDLEIQDPAGNVYYGNYFTDDDNKDGVIDAGTENCPSIDGNTANVLDAGPWSLPTCASSDHDSDNPMEAVMLSPDSDYNGLSLECTGGGSISCSDDTDCPGVETCTVPDAYNQLGGQPAGNWTIRVIGAGMTADTNYAVVITGGVCNDSSVRFDAGNYVCNDSARITVNDIDTIDDPAAGLSSGEISTRVTVDVLDVDGVTVLDTEIGLTFVQQGSSLRFVSDKLQLSNGTQFDPGNGILDVRHGQSIRVTYQDESTDGGVLPGDIRRVATSVVDCTTAINFGSLVFGKVGANGIFSIDGGCEQNLRGGFEFGFPDEYMDAGESVGYGLAFNSNESETLVDAIASLRCVEADLDSPEDCLPGTSQCADPNRENNPACSGVTVTDSPKVVGDIPVGVAMAAYFNVTMDSVLTSGDEIEMILGISSPAAGKSTPGLAVSRHTLDVDENSTYYSTDFP
ncbi:MAG: S8 family serine peptidase, partial [Acidobacteria bacterium]|nr:S8 family serine peptidase [Candidatus Polarisedimenticola svalbardensis]